VLVVEIMLIGKQVASLEESLPTAYRETTSWHGGDIINLRLSIYKSVETTTLR